MRIFKVAMIALALCLAQPVMAGQLHSKWVVEDIGGGGIVDSSRVTLDFGTDGRLIGRSSCNRYTATYAQTGARLTFGKFAATRMACAQALMEQELQFFQALENVRSFEIDKTGSLLLKNVGEMTLILAQQIS